MTLEHGRKYEVETLHFAGWTAGDGTGAEGYHLQDYFAADGTYLGPDEHGIEPVFEGGDLTIYIYSNETGEQVDHHVGAENADCEKWADEHWGSNDCHWSYVGVSRSNAVPFEPTHVITLDNGERIEVQLVDGAAYTRAEWDAADQADYERQDNGDWTFQGEPFAGTVKAI